MRIGEVSELSGVSVRMLRHYDRLGLVTPSARTSADYRDYTRDDLDRLLQVEALRTLGLTLAEVREALDDPTSDAAGVLDRVREETRRRIRAGEELLDRLETFGASRTWEDVLTVTALLTVLRDGTSRARQAAAYRIGPDAPPEVVSGLVDAWRDETDVNAASALRWAIGRTCNDTG